MFVSNGCASTEYSRSVAAYSRSVILEISFPEQTLLKHVVDANSGTACTVDRIVVVAFKASEHCRDVQSMHKIQDPRIDSVIDSRVHCVSTKNKLTEPSTKTRDVYTFSESSESVEQKESSQSG